MLKETMGAILKTLRQMHGYSQQEIANKLRKSANAVYSWEVGNTSPPVDDLFQLCKIYNITPNQAYGWDPIPELEEYIRKREDYEKEIEQLIEQRKELERQQKLIENRIKKYTDYITHKH